MDDVTILTGDVMEQLTTLPDQSVQTVVTSPPYWGLRDYQTATWEGGDPNCLHRKSELRRGVNLAESVHSTMGGAKKVAEAGWITYADVCEQCGARRIDRQIGLERTPYEYVDKMVRVFREVRRVLKDDGTLWLNLGDSYATAGGSGYQGKNGERANRSFTQESLRFRDSTPGLKPKDLCMMPARVAMALQADGWWLRSDIIWSKPNPMPESVQDRPTKAHEYIFLMSKSERYYYDADEIREATQYDPRDAHWDSKMVTSFHDHAEDLGKGIMQKRPAGFIRMSNPLGRNKRSVWEVSTEPFPDAHFATFPQKLIEPCILAGSRPGDMVLDPFGHAATTGVVARRLGRKAILIELNPKYVELAQRRLSGVSMGLPLDFTSTNFSQEENHAIDGETAD